jgi:hypothetical protein
MIAEKDIPTPGDLEERYLRALASPDLSPEEKRELATLMGMSLMFASATRLLLDDLGIR